MEDQFKSRIKEIQSLLDWFEESEDVIQEAIQKREDWINAYPAKSADPEKLRYGTEKACIEFAIKYAEYDPYDLTRIEIGTLIKAKRIVESEED
jgi:hypothetical protein